MASGFLQPLISHEHFDDFDGFERARHPEARRSELERCIEAAIDTGEPTLLHAATAAIDLLDAIDGDPDVELNGDEGDGEAFSPHMPRYGIDQTKLPLNLHQNRPSWFQFDRAIDHQLARVLDRQRRERTRLSAGTPALTERSSPSGADLLDNH